MKWIKQKLFLLIPTVMSLVWLIYVNKYSFVTNKYIRISFLSWNTSNTDKVRITGDGSETVRELRKVELDNAKVESEVCKNITFPNQMPVDASWMPVVSNRLAFVYSAYHVNTTENKVVIIGALTRSTSKYYCQFWRRNSKNSEDFRMKYVLATPQTLPESHGKRYSAALFYCKTESDYVPNYVSIATGSCDVPSNLLIVQQGTKPSKYIRNFTVCLSPLNLHYTAAFELVEWIELNRILGADKFTVYNHSVGSNVLRVLDYYTKRGVVEVLHWNLPMNVSYVRGDKIRPEIHYFGQVVALNDCLYRNKKFSKFVANIDLDEFIIPHSDKTQTWHDLVSDKTAYLFRNTFFKKEWSCNTNKTKITNLKTMNQYPFVTLKKLQHEWKVSMPKTRSKYFARTSDVFKLMIHEVPGVIAESVPTNIAMLHHYRHWGGDNNETENKRVYDDTIPVKYGDKLITRVVQTWTKLNNTNMVAEDKGGPGI